jgi:hypothetical protein
LGAPASTTWMTFPGRRVPRLPKLPRPDPSSVVSTRAEELVIAYSDPAEAAVLEAGSSVFRRFTLPVTGDPFVTRLLVRSIREVYVVLSDTEHDRVLAFDGEQWTEMALPGPTSVRSLVATSEGTLWLLDGNASVYRRSPGKGWEPVAAPAGAPPPAALIASEEPRRLWVQLESDSGEGMGPLWTMGEVREQTASAH